MTTSAPGELVGPYRLERKLGAGGMGVVWLATDTLLERPVAIKMMRGLDGDDADELRARFFREARAAARIKSRHVVQVLQLGMTTTGDVYIAMELLDGVSLQDVVERGAMAPTRVVNVGRQIAEAMQAAHDIDVVHRDLKPANVMLVREADTEVAKVLDFGIAKITSERGPAITQAGVVLGTVPYLSPEQIDGGVADARSDIYAFGMMLYRMLAGRPPWDIVDVGVMIHHHRAVAPPPVRERSPYPQTIPALLDDVVLRCLKKSPADRWQTMRELGAALGAAMTAVSTATATPERTSLSPAEHTEDGSQIGQPIDAGAPAPAVNDLFAAAMIEVAAASSPQVLVPPSPPLSPLLHGRDDDDDAGLNTLDEPRTILSTTQVAEASTLVARPTTPIPFAAPRSQTPTLPMPRAEVPSSPSPSPSSPSAPPPSAPPPSAPQQRQADVTVITPRAPLPLSSPPPSPPPMARPTFSKAAVLAAVVAVVVIAGARLLSMASTPVEPTTDQTPTAVGTPPGIDTAPVVVVPEAPVETPPVVVPVVVQEAPVETPPVVVPVDTPPVVVDPPRVDPPRVDPPPEAPRTKKKPTPTTTTTTPPPPHVDPKSGFKRVRS